MRLPLGLALLTALAASLDPGGHLENVEQRTLDARTRHHAAPTPFTQRIVILDIGEETIERLRPLYGRWPWPRSLHGEVAEYLAADGAAAVGFDLLFAEQVTERVVDAAGWETLAALARNADLREARGELGRRIEALQPGLDDREFVAAVARAGNVFQAAVFAPGGPGAHAPPDAPAPPVPVAAHDRSPVRGQALLPFTDLARASRGIGHINVSPDTDGTIRRFEPLVWQASRQAAYPALGLAIAAHVKGLPPAALRRTEGGLALGDAVLPLAANDSAWLRYPGGTPHRAADGGQAFQSFYRHIPFELVLATMDLRAAGREAPLPAGTFRDSIVLVSALAAGLSDLRVTPFSPVTPGIEIHANIIDSLLSGRFLRPPPAPAGFLLTLVLCLAGALAAQKLRFRIGVPLVLAAGGGYAYAAWAAFGAGWVLPLVPPLAAMAFAFGGTLVIRAAVAERDKRRLRAAFGHYLAPSVLEEVLRHPDRLRLGGERRRMSVLFSDIAGFTTISERLPPEEIGALLNGYLGRMAGCVAQTEGTLDKFVGDAVMAEWNAPLAQPDHAARACAAALSMLEEVGHQAAAWAAAGAALDIRIGINSGEMAVGNMGSGQIFDYTVIGNEVNTAARLEPLNKAFGTHILVAGATREEAEQHRPGHFVFRRLGGVNLKGRTEPLQVFELAGRADRLDNDTRRELADFEAALTQYQAAAFADALPRFRALLARRPHDGPAAVFAALCEGHLAHPPPPDWNGAFIQTEK